MQIALIGATGFVGSAVLAELLQRGQALPPQEPWASMGNTGHW